jgi:hypothetical protein
MLKTARKYHLISMTNLPRLLVGLSGKPDHQLMRWKGVTRILHRRDNYPFSLLYVENVLQIPQQFFV